MARNGVAKRPAAAYVWRAIAASAKIETCGGVMGDGGENIGVA